MKKSGKVLARCVNYNGSKDVLFMMNAEDERLGVTYAKLADAVYSHKLRTLTAAGVTYNVFGDWSVKEVYA